MPKMSVPAGVASLRMLLALAAALLVGCEGVGDGSRPDPSTAQILKIGNAVSETRLYTCFPESLVITVGFTNGDRGNFTRRVRWTSSDPAVLVVGNAGDPIPGESNLFFSTSGQLLPRKAGTVTVTAEGTGIRKSIQLEVRDPTNVRVRADGYGTPDATAIVLAPKTQQSLDLLADFDGYTHSQGSSASWSFQQPDTTLAEFVQYEGMGLRTIVTKDKTGGPLRAVPKLFGCGPEHPVLQGVGMDVSVANVAGLAVRREIENAPNISGGVTRMVEGTSELVRVYNRLGQDENGNPILGQDLSSQPVANTSVMAKTSQPTVLVAGFSSLRTALTAATLPEGTTDSGPIDVRFCVAAPVPEGSPAGTQPDCRTEPELNSETLVFHVVKDALQSFTLQPDPASIVALQSLQLRATGTFASGLQQDITRQVGWTSSDANTVEVGFSGFAVSRKAQPAQVTITARNDGAAVTKEQTLTVNVVCPAGAPTDACATP